MLYILGIIIGALAAFVTVFWAMTKDENIEIKMFTVWMLVLVSIVYFQPWFTFSMHFNSVQESK